MVLFLCTAKMHCNEYNNGEGRMTVIEAYDDIRILRAKELKQDSRSNDLLDSIFSNLTSPKYVQRLLAAKEESSMVFIVCLSL
jgi:hypothetical protein